MSNSRTEARLSNLITEPQKYHTTAISISLRIPATDEEIDILYHWNEYKKLPRSNKMSLDSFDVLIEAHDTIQVDGEEKTLRRRSKIKQDGTNTLYRTKIADGFAAGTFKVLNQDINIRLEDIAISKLSALTSQREVSLKWVYDMFVDLGGINSIDFGVLFVAFDGEHYWVWDGNGRFTMAKESGMFTHVKCLVMDISVQEAKRAFARTQSSRGRRAINPEQVFVNSCAGGDPDAIKVAGYLEVIGSFVEGDTSTPTPEICKDNGGIEMKANTIVGAYDIAKGKHGDAVTLAIMKQAYDMIAESFGDEVLINQSLYYALVYILKTTASARVNGFNTRLQGYLNYLGDGDTQSGVSKVWKQDAKGLSGNSGAAQRFATSFVLAFRAWKKSKTYGNSFNWDALDQELLASKTKMQLK